MSIQLYFSPGACSFVPHLMLEKAGVPFEPIMVKLHKGEQHGDDRRARPVGVRRQLSVVTQGDHPLPRARAR